MVRTTLGFRRSTRSLLLSPLIAFALLTAPTVRAIQAACDQCPPTCPMHRTDKPKPERKKLSCHNKGGARMHHEEDADAEKPNGLVLSRPPCGHTGTVPGVAMGPMILPDDAPTWFRSPGNPFDPGLQLLRVRFLEPPSPPPPIVIS